jgi:hypothetical protein
LKSAFVADKKLELSSNVSLQKIEALPVVFSAARYCGIAL